VSPLRTRPKEPDQVCAAAEDLAREAAAQLAGPGQIGEHLGTEADAERVVTHLFQCLDPAYRGWRWAITVSRASRSKVVTVSEGLLLPGPGSVLAPPWVPWRERLRPGDLGVGDLLPAPSDDERLVPVASLEGEDGSPDWQEASWAAVGVTSPAGTAPEDAVAAGEVAAGQATAEPGQAAGAEPPSAAGSEPGTGEAGSAEGAAGDPQAAATTTGAGPVASGQPATAPAGNPGGKAASGGQGRGRKSRRGSGTVESWDAVPERSRVLSAIGRDEAAVRWYGSEHGPESPLAHAAPAPCGNCGFFVRLAGPLGRVFGVCANSYAPDDGRVVSLDHGCGAHSEALLPPGVEAPVSPVIDELGYDLVDVPGVSVEETVFEPIEHG
jgi:hypothetical protein